MIYCKKCGSGLDDDAEFCTNCGATVNETGYRDNGPERRLQRVTDSFSEGFQRISDSYGRHQDVSPQLAREQDVFVDPNEKLISRIGGGWFINFALMGKVRTVNAYLTDRRCYLQGNMYTSDGTKLKQAKQEKVVNVEDINATGFQFERTLNYLIWAVLLTVLAFITLIFFVAIDVLIVFLAFVFAILVGAAIMFWQYFKSKRTYFYIEYAGGGIKFEVILSAYEQMKMFNKEIHRVKDYSRAKIRRESVR